MGPKKRNINDVPSLAERIKASNKSPLEPTKRSLHETRQVDRALLVRNFIRLSCREFAIRPLMIQAVEEARATNREVINIYQNSEIPTRRQNTSKGEIENNETILYNKDSKSKKESTRRLKDIDNNGTTLADLVNGMKIQNKKECLDPIYDPEVLSLKETSVFIGSGSDACNSKASIKSFNSKDITTQSVDNKSKGESDINYCLLDDNQEKQTLLDATNSVINNPETIYPQTTEQDYIGNSDHLVSDLPYTKSTGEIDVNIQSISDQNNENTVSNISSIFGPSVSKSKRPLVPRYKAVRVSHNTSNNISDNKPTYSNSVDNLEQAENGIRSVSPVSTATVLPLSETDEDVTTDEIASSSLASPDVVTKMADHPALLNLSSSPQTLRTLGFPKSNTPRKFNDFPATRYRKQDILTENYFSDTLVSSSRNTHQTHPRVYTNKFEINSHRNRIDQVIDGQTRKTLVQNQLKKFGVGGNTRRSQKNTVSSVTANFYINPRTALNDGFLTTPNEFSPKSDPFHEFPKKLGWFLKSGELEYDERYIFEDKRQTKSKAYMKVQRQHYKSRTMDVIPQNDNWKIQTETRRGKRHTFNPPVRHFCNQEHRKPIITNRLRFRKGVVTKPLPKRKPFITVV